MSIPYFSQFSDVKDEYWKHRTCTIACLASVISWIRPELEQELRPLDHFVTKAVALDARDPNIGWIHEKLIELARSYGVTLVRREYKETNDASAEEMIQNGFDDISLSLSRCVPVIVSVKRGFNEDGTPHTVLLVNENNGRFEIYEPEARSKEDGGIRIMSREEFVKYWRRLAIFPVLP